MSCNVTAIFHLSFFYFFYHSLLILSFLGFQYFNVFVPMKHDLECCTSTFLRPQNEHSTYFFIAQVSAPYSSGEQWGSLKKGVGAGEREIYPSTASGDAKLMSHNYE